MEMEKMHPVKKIVIYCTLDYFSKECSQYCKNVFFSWALLVNNVGNYPVFITRVIIL